MILSFQYDEKDKRMSCLNKDRHKVSACFANTKIVSSFSISLQISMGQWSFAKVNGHKRRENRIRPTVL